MILYPTYTGLPTNVRGVNSVPNLNIPTTSGLHGRVNKEMRTPTSNPRRMSKIEYGGTISLFSSCRSPASISDLDSPDDEAGVDDALSITVFGEVVIDLGPLYAVSIVASSMVINAWLGFILMNKVSLWPKIVKTFKSVSGGCCLTSEKELEWVKNLALLVHSCLCLLKIRSVRLDGHHSEITVPYLRKLKFYHYDLYHIMFFVYPVQQLKCQNRLNRLNLYNNKNNQEL